MKAAILLCTRSAPHPLWQQPANFVPKKSQNQSGNFVGIKSLEIYLKKKIISKKVSEMVFVRLCQIDPSAEGDEDKIYFWLIFNTSNHSS